MEALIVIFVAGLISMFIAMARKPLLVLLTAVLGLLTAGGMLAMRWVGLINNTGYTGLNLNYEGLQFDQFSLAYSAVAVIFSLLIILVGYQKFKEEVEHTGEYISLLLFSLCGVICLLSFTDLFMFFLGLEIMSIPIYVMAGSKKKDLLSSEASMKYFFTGAFATGILLFGIAWMYGALGTFNLAEIGDQIMTSDTHSSLLYVGVLIILASFLFKIGSVPFHFWSPDVYAGSPNIVTSFMAAVVKLGAFGAFFRLFTLAFGGLHEFLVDAIMFVSIITMFVGNLSAIRQTKFKRLLAYSSITHVGYALICMLDTSLNSGFNLWAYLFAYGFSIIALITISLIIDDEEDELSSFKGFARRNPFAGFVMILALLSLAGVPPLAGFFGKYLVFSSAISTYPTLVVIALINSGIAIYYYLRMMMNALSKDENENVNAYEVQPLYAVVLAICALGLIFGGVVTWF
jgi:NADH-quinone oxidoreductase subunit N